MLIKIVRFELSYQLRHPLFWCLGLIYFAMALALGSSDIGLQLPSPSAIGLRNAPIVVLRMMPILSLLALFPIAAFVSTAALRDLELDSASLYLSKPIDRRQYLGGRYLGAMLISLALLVIALFGLYLANFAPWQSPDRLGLVQVRPYVYGFGMILLPNLLIMGSAIFAVAAWSRRQTAVYLAAVFFIVMQDVIEVLAFGLDMPLLSSLIEPSSVVAIEMSSRYWSMGQQTVWLPDLLSALSLNRLLWMGASALLLFVAVKRFRLEPPGRGNKRVKKVEEAIDLSSQSLPHVLLPKPSVSIGLAGYARQLWRQWRLEISEVITGAPYLSLSVIGMVFVVALALNVGSHDGVSAYPRTEFMLLAIRRVVSMTLVLILVIYAGELVHGQRSLKIADLYDATPVNNLTLFAAKVGALIGMSVLFLAVAAILTMALQLGSGFTDLRLDQYLAGLGLIALPLLPTIALALLLQVLTNHKTIGLLLCIAVLAATLLLPKLGFEDILYRYGSAPALSYSAMDGYGPYLRPFLAAMLYWNLVAALFLLLAWALWPRGRDTGMGLRWRRALAETGKPAMAVGVVLGVSAIACGAWIYVNNRVDNDYLDRNKHIARLASYERQYQRYADLALPNIVEMELQVDLYPDLALAELSGQYLLMNRSDQPIEQLAFSMSPRWVEGALPVQGGVALQAFDMGAHQFKIRDDKLGFYLVALEQPLEPGEERELTFQVHVDQSAFRHAEQDFLVIENGSFFSGRSFLPVLGYAEGNQIQDPVIRAELALAPLVRAAPRDDPHAREHNYLRADWITVDTTISTTVGQTAIAPGNLVRQWQDGERAYFRYRNDQPLVNLLPFISGRYAVKRERWEGVDLELYYHPAHAVNIDHYLEVTKASLAYMSKHFGPYPHPQLRIVEIPSYHGKIAFSFGQVIAFSESWGYSLNLNGATYDPLAAVLAHEVAHQWWNHQLVPANTQGATMIAESLCDYAAAMILGELYGSATVDEFRRISRDIYLRGRAQERIAELPLALVENQAYVHYGKGPIALLQLKDQMGEAALNAALASFLSSARFSGAPYPTSIQLLEHVRAAAPAQKQLIAELFEQLHLLELTLVRAETTEDNGLGYVTTIEVTAKQWRDDGHGRLTEANINRPLTIALYTDADGKVPLAHFERALTSRSLTLSLQTDQQPLYARLDPGHRLLEIDTADNQRAVTVVTPLDLGADLPNTSATEPNHADHK